LNPRIYLVTSLATRALCAALLIATSAAAHQYPLSSTAIRQAYFLGKESAEKRQQFFAKYEKQLPMPQTGPHVSWIRLETPYAVVVERTASQLLGNYVAADAQEEFLGKPAIFRLRVRIDLTSTYPAHTGSSAGVHLLPDDFWQDFQVRLAQSAEIPHASVRGQPIYSLASSEGGSVLLGAELVLEYDAEKISSDIATVEVDTPDGQRVRTTFDLTRLR
jgi:hypothetical protein